METMYLDILPPLAGSVEYKLTTVFFKGGDKPEVKETPHQRALAEIAMKKYQRYHRVTQPLERAAIADVMGEGSANQLVKRAGGILNADQAQTLAAAAPGYGHDPSSGMTQQRITDPTRAAIVAQSAADLAGLGRKQRITGMKAAVDIGQGKATDAQLGFEALAGPSVNAAIDNSKTRFNEDASRLNTIGAGAGAIAGYGAGMYDRAYRPKTTA